MLPVQSCVILVPAGGAIEGGCEDGLRELERRGYPVWRIRGYSAVDAARCQMATDALAQGFEELFWIDSDVVFEPDDVEKLRRHDLPFVCAIYPKKGPRQFAANYLPGTESLLFGPRGGLTEILYSGFGFNCTKRAVYEDIQRHCQLPLCNEMFPRPLIPYFMPSVKNDPVNGPWYLSEDYAFCERARQSGHRVMVDTTIRLWHVGSYRYSWEDAGTEKQRYRNYHFVITPPENFKSAGSTAGVSGIDVKEAFFLNDPVWQTLRRDYPWPEVRPLAPPNRTHGGLNEGTKTILERVLSQSSQLIVEVGSWLGKSTRFLLERAPQAVVVAIDHWQGSPEHLADPETQRLLPRLFETFLANCWDSRQRLLPLRMPSVAGLQLLASRGLRPNIIYLDADHTYAAVKSDLESCLTLFPEAIVVGDDWNWEGVRHAVDEVVGAKQLKVETEGVGWMIQPVS